MANAKGWGTGTGPEGVIPEEPLQPEDLINDIREIRKKYVVPGTMNTRDMALTAYQAKVIDMTATPVNAIIVTIASGVVYGYFGDYSSQTGKAPNGAPHFVADASISPNTQTIPIPLGNEWKFTVQEAANSTAEICVTPMAL
jgi:hypothetical protein